MLGLKNTLWNSVSGMNASQAGLSTVGHNIANADTEGYSRQQVRIGNRGPLRVFTGSEQISQAGQGSNVDNITRAHSKFLERQLLRDRLERGFFEGQSEALQVFERLFDSGATETIGDTIDNFFNSIRELSQDPSSNGHRDMFLEDAQRLARGFNQLARDARGVQEDIDRTIVARVARINQLAEVIAESNARVGNVEATGKMANDFRDQRDKATKEIAELADVRVMFHKDGSAQIDLANGFTLVQGNNAASLSTLADPARAWLLSIQHTSINGVTTTDISNGITRGELGGLLAARDSTIAGHINDIDTLAFNFVDQVNSIHRAGFGLDGVGGRDLFTPIAAAPGASLLVQVDAAIVADPNQLASAIDPLAVPGDNRNLLRLADLHQTQQAGLGNITFNHFYGEVLRGVGADVDHNRQFGEFHQVRFEQSDSLRESIEGVSIDDEMVDLTRFQKHFEASARIMDTVNRLMDEILQLVR